MAESVKREPKKTYEKPILVVYGTVKDLTEKVGPHGKGDGGLVPGKKHSHL